MSLQIVLNPLTNGETDFVEDQLLTQGVQALAQPDPDNASYQQVNDLEIDPVKFTALARYLIGKTRQIDAPRGGILGSLDTFILNFSPVGGSGTVEYFIKLDLAARRVSVRFPTNDLPNFP